MQDNTKTTKFGNKLFKDIYFFYRYFFSDKCTQDVLQNVLFPNDEWATYLPLYTSTLVNNCSLLGLPLASETY